MAEVFRSFIDAEPGISLADDLFNEIAAGQRDLVHEVILAWAEKHLPEGHLSSDFFSSGKNTETGYEFSLTCAHLSPVRCHELHPGITVTCIQKQPDGSYLVKEHKYGECDHPDFIKED